jgi:hypothetical protein
MRLTRSTFSYKKILLSLLLFLPFFLFSFFIYPVKASAFTLSGSIKDSIGNPISLATVDVFTASTTTSITSTSSDSSGNYVVTIDGGTYDIIVTPPSNSSFGPANKLGHTISSDTIINFVLVAAGTVTLSGHVYDPLGNPLANVQVAGGMTDASGYYSWETQPQTFYELRIIPENDNVDMSLNVPQKYIIYFHNYSITQDTTWDITIPAKKIIVHVQDSSGNPISGTMITASETSYTRYLPLGGNATDNFGTSGYGATRGGEGIPGPITDASGNATLWLFLNGSYTINASPVSGSIYSPFILQNVVVTGDQTELISLQFIHDRPVTTATLSPSPNNEGNYSDPTTVTLSATAANGFSIANTYYTIDAEAQQTYSSQFTVTGNGSHTVTYWSIDSVGVPESPNTKTFAITIPTPTPTPVNVAPIVGIITAPVDPVQVNTSINAHASFTDANTIDTHTATWNWGDGTTTGTIIESNGSGTVSNNHTYTQAGVYAITLTVYDNHEASGTSTYQYVTVFDPAAGWVTGSKEYLSPAGAVIGSPSATGKANFGFTARYSGGYLQPVGNKWASLDFNSGSTHVSFNATSYTYLIITGNKSILTGLGAYNGVSGYSVLITAIDNGNGHATDYVRYQIKNPSGVVVYDTQPGATDTTDPTAAVSKGKIDVH